MSQTDFSKLACSIGELADKGPIRRSSIYNQIASGRLRARKIGRRTVVLDEDWREFLVGLPAVSSAKPAASLLQSPTQRRPRGQPHKVPAEPTGAELVPSPSDLTDQSGHRIRSGSSGNRFHLDRIEHASNKPTKTAKRGPLE